MDNAEYYSTFHGKDLRKGRVSVPGQIYFVTAVTKDRNPVFKNFCHGRTVVNALRHHQHYNNAETLAFVIMPDHFHWLFSLGENLSLSNLVGSVKRVSSKKVNLQLEQTNTSTWQKGFYDHALREEENIREVAQYMIANPLRANLVKQIGDYPLWDAKWLL